jgi:hypothetical protein
MTPAASKRGRESSCERGGEGGPGDAWNHFFFFFFFFFLSFFGKKKRDGETESK